MTRVTQTYTPTLNTSVTVRNGLISKVTLWVTGNPAALTERTEIK